MIVEVQGMGFWTRVRLPSTPFSGSCGKRNLTDSDSCFLILMVAAGMFYARIGVVFLTAFGIHLTELDRI